MVVRSLVSALECGERASDTPWPLPRAGATWVTWVRRYPSLSSRVARAKTVSTRKHRSRVAGVVISSLAWARNEQSWFTSKALVSGVNALLY